MYNGVSIIAEVKTESPFGYRSAHTWEELFGVADKIGDIISVHTDARWGGSFELIAKARALTRKPILAKGIHATDEDVVEALLRGADFVLVVGRVPATAADKCFIEPLSVAELAALPLSQKAVWNSRDLSDGSPKRETFQDARKVFSGWLCQASNIKTAEDIEPLADAVLVGTHLLTFAKTI